MGNTIAIDGFIFSYQQFGGVSRLLRSVLPLVADQVERCDIEVWCWRPKPEALPIHENIRVKTAPRLRVPSFRPHRVFRPVRAASEAINSRTRERMCGRTGAEIWHSTMYWHPDRWAGPVITNVYDLKEELFPELSAADRSFVSQKERAIRRADALLCISEATKRDVVNVYGVDPRTVKVAPLAVDPIFKYELGRAMGRGGGSFVLYVGRRDRFKGFREFVETYARWSRRADIQLIIAGGPLEPREVRLFDELGVTGSVVVRENPDDRTLCGLYNSALALIYPSIYEGFGLPLVEAMACGCPIVVSDIPSSAEVVGSCGYYFEPADPASLIDALDRAVDGARSPEKTRASTDRAGAFSWESAAHSWSSLYRSIIDGSIAPTAMVG